MKKISLIIFLMCLHNSEILAQEKRVKKITFLEYSEIKIGICVNKSALDLSYGFNTNFKTAYLASLNIVNFKNFSFNISTGYRTKSLIGLGEKNPTMRFKKNQINVHSRNYYNDSLFNIDFHYINIDAVFKVVFLKKKDFNPFIVIGPRFNFLTSYEYKNNVRDNKSTSSIKNNVLPNLQKQYFNMVYGCGITYKVYPKLKLSLQYELNDDLQKRPASTYIGYDYTNTQKPSISDKLYYGLRFQTQTIYIGCEYSF